MTLITRILSLLLLASTLVAQDSPEPPEPEKAPAVTENAKGNEGAIVDPAETERQEVPAADTEAATPAEPVEPDWDPTKEEPVEVANQAERRRGNHGNRGNHGRQTFGQNIVVRTNEVVHDMVIIGGSADIQGEVERDVVAIGGSVKVSGKVGGDVVIVGGKGEFSGEVDGDTVVVLGQADIAGTAQLHRDAVFIGGPVHVAEEASIGGERVTIPLGDFLPQIEWLKAYLVRGPLLGRWLTFQLGWPWVIAGTFLAIYMGLLLVFPAAARAVYTALEERPVTSIFAGLLTLILFAPLTLLLVISVVGIIVVPFLKIALLLAVLFGKVGVLCFLGRGFGRTSGMAKLQAPFLAFVIGGILLTLAYAVPFFGIFAWAMATVFGLGGAIVALSGTFKREDANIPPAPVIVSTIRPGGGASVASAGMASAGTHSAPGATMTGGGTAAATATSFVHDIAALSPQDTILLPRAGFWARFLAAMLDLLLIAVAVALLPIIGPALFIPLAVAYFVAMWTWRGTTIGGLILGQRIVRTDGTAISFSVALVRSLLSIFSMLVFFLGFLWAAWDREKQTWHDKIAGTVVVRMPKNLALI